MNLKISFKQRAELATENLSKQLPIAYEQAILQVQRLKAMSQTKEKKQRN